MPLKIKIFGSSGRFGKTIAALIVSDPVFQIAEVAPDLYIDVSAAVALTQHLGVALGDKKPIVIGTTGLSESDFQRIREASQEIPVFYSPNFSLGIAILQKLAIETARQFHRDAHIDLIETHHATKKDAPSGSALMLAQAISEVASNPVKIHSLRTGNVVGEHTALFNTREERITLSHEAYSRDAFARGALQAALFLSKQRQGLYDMQSLLETCLKRFHHPS